MNFDGTEGSEINLNEAAALTKNYRSQNPDGIKGIFFGKEKILSLLNEEHSVGVRIYFGLDEDDSQKLVLVGVDENKNDLTEGVIVDVGIICPPQCGVQNRLNADF
ncbi:MAG: hypothetical protein H0X62_14725 [Bacteroidetes bacterium]|nr:hypothetical protein [Bacteroidota bacterium]